jgi:hypothetical protein
VTPRHAWVVIALLATALMALSSSSALAAAGDLDPSFDEDGRRVLPSDGFAAKVLVQPDGKKVFSYVGQYEAIGVLIDHEGGIILPGKASAAGAGVIACAVRRAETCSPAARAAIA